MVKFICGLMGFTDMSWGYMMIYNDIYIYIMNLIYLYTLMFLTVSFVGIRCASQ